MSDQTQYLECSTDVDAPDGVAVYDELPLGSPLLGTPLPVRLPVFCGIGCGPNVGPFAVGPRGVQVRRSTHIRLPVCATSHAW